MIIKNKQKSFTLIELLVVIVIIGILAGVITISTSNNIAKARDSKVSSAILGISKLLKTYSMDTFPIETTPCNIKTSCTNLKSKIDIPNIDQDMYYKTSSSGNFFVIYANKPSDTSLSFEINSNIEKVKEVPSFDNLVAYYPLSIGTSNGSTISDMSPNFNHGTNHGATFTEGVDGNMNTGMRFDGVSDYIDCGSNSSLNILKSITISAWADISILDNAHRWIVRKGWSDASFFFGKNINDKIVLVINNKADIYTSTTAPNALLGWHHYVGIYDKNVGKIKIFIDGYNTNWEFLLSESINTNNSIMSMSGYPAYGQYFNGLIDDVRIYNKALTENEIKLLYNNKN